MEKGKSVHEIIFIKDRFNRKAFLDYLKNKLEGKRKGRKLNILDNEENNLAKYLTEHIEKCSMDGVGCKTEEVYEKALRIIELKKEQIFSSKNFLENVISNPVGLGILLIGVTNLIVAIFNIFKS